MLSRAVSRIGSASRTRASRAGGELWAVRTRLISTKGGLGRSSLVITGAFRTSTASRAVLPSIGQCRTMFIRTEPTPNPQSLKFKPGQTVLEEQFGAGLDITPKSEEVRRSPLARKLFAVDGVVRVFYGRDFISITKREDVGWEDLKPFLFSVIMDYYAEGKPIVTESAGPPADTDVLEEDDEVVAMIKELLDTKIRPAVHDDGGDIYYRGFDPATGIVKLKLAGSCAGCPSSVVTLKNGVENMLMHYIPEVNGIEEVEDELDKEGNKEFQSFEERLKAAGVPSV